MKVIKKLVSTLLVLGILTSASLSAYAAPTLSKNSSKELLKLINNERKSAGVDTLKWDDDLAEAAEIRALEIAQKYTTDHSRPDGRSFFSVSTKVWGENTAWGQKTPAAAMESWMNSKGHRENLLRDTFTIVGEACAIGDDGVYYWVQLFGNGNSNAGWAGVKKYTLDPFGDSNLTVEKKSSGSTKDSSDESAGKSSAGADEITDSLKKAITSSADSAVSVRVKDADAISPATFKTLADTASGVGKTVTIQADTMNASGKSVQGRMVLDPNKLKGRKSDIKPGVYVDNKSVADVKAAMEKRYKNTMAYIHMDHQGTLTAATLVGAKVKLDGLDTANLQIYVYDQKKDTVTQLSDANYEIEDGMLRFYTKTAGDIVISDKKLA